MPLRHVCVTNDDKSRLNALDDECTNIFQFFYAFGWLAPCLFFYTLLWRESRGLVRALVIGFLSFFIHDSL